MRSGNPHPRRSSPGSGGAGPGGAAGGRRGRGAAAMGAPVPPRSAPSTAPQRGLGERRRRGGSALSPVPPPGPARPARSSCMSGPGAQSRSRRLPGKCRPRGGLGGMGMGHRTGRASRARVSHPLHPPRSAHLMPLAKRLCPTCRHRSLQPRPPPRLSLHQPAAGRAARLL